MDFPDAAHTGGAVSGFTPNLSQEQIAELDRRRGLGDDGPFNDPAELVNKKPWLNKDGTHKSSEGEMHGMKKTKEAIEILKGALRVPEGGEPFAKPELPKREGESEQERQVRSHVTDEKNNPDKYPGGRKQAIAIGISESKKGIEQQPFHFNSPKPPAGADSASTSGTINVPKKPVREGTFGQDRLPKVMTGKSVDDGDKDDKMSDIGDKLFGKANPFKAASERARDRAAGRKERTIGMRHAGARSIGKGDPGKLDSEKDDVDVLERLLSHEKEEMEDEEKGLTMGPRGTGGMGGPGGGVAPAPPPPPTPSFPAGGGGGSGTGGTGGGGVGPSMGIGKTIGGRMPGPSDFSASMEAIKALNSRSMHIPTPLGPYDPFGIQNRGTLIPTSGPQSFEGQPMTLKAQAETHDLCPTHGITYRKALGCHPCNIQKCQECEKCGSQMHKAMGGALRCPRGH